MITKEELKEYAKIRRLNLGQAEKDYFQAVALFIIYQNYGKELVFKGGTALSKCFGLNRFSEDLDFTAKEKPDIAKIENGFKRFKIDFEKEPEEYPDGLKTVFRIKGPLYAGIRQSLCRFTIDISLREKVLLKPEIKTIGRFLEEIPSFEVFVMQQKEILAEKIRALMTRNKARDIYDLWFLLNKGIEFDRELANEKMKYYKEKFDLGLFYKRLKMKKPIWEPELRPLVPRVPDFKAVLAFIIDKIK